MKKVVVELEGEKEIPKGMEKKSPNDTCSNAMGRVDSYRFQNDNCIMYKKNCLIN